MIIKRSLLPAAFFLLLGTVSIFIFIRHRNSETSPVIKEDGRKWRIAYYEGGGYSEYNYTMQTLIDGLMELGWLEKTELPGTEINEPLPYWEWLGSRENKYLEFRSEDGYSAGWDTDLRSRLVNELIEKLKSGEIDLVIAMGTWAGTDLATDEHSVPTMVMSTSNPVQAGIIESSENSGREHVTARVDPDRYYRQLRMFHRIFGFKTLGIAYENTEEGRLYSALEEGYSVAEERGFEVVLYEVSDTNTDLREVDRTCLEAFSYLAENSEAVYVTALRGVDRNIDAVVEILKAEKTPSFSMVGSSNVQRGILMSLSSDSGYEALGDYSAEKFALILNGAAPSVLEQEFRDPLKIALNLTTAEEIGVVIPQKIMDISNEIYR